MRIYQNFPVLKFLRFSRNRRESCWVRKKYELFRENEIFFLNFPNVVSQIFSKFSRSQFCWIRIKYKFFTENMRFFIEFFKSIRVSAIFLEFLFSQSRRVRRKYEISEENGRLFLEFVRNMKFLRFSLNIELCIL